MALKPFWEIIDDLYTLFLQDDAFTTPLIVPALGLELRTSVYVQVKAANLTDQ